MARTRDANLKPARTKKASRKSALRSAAAATPSAADLDAVLRLIDEARARALTAVNTALMDLYWALGEYLSRRVADDGWGQGTVEALGGFRKIIRPLNACVRLAW
jgi:hypothetical protein